MKSHAAMVLNIHFIGKKTMVVGACLNTGTMQVYFGERAAHIDQLRAILDLNLKEAWGETKRHISRE